MMKASSPGSKSPRKVCQSHTSPFRYPGGKAFLSDYIKHRIGSINSNQAEYAEPFAGGAGAGVKLLSEGVIKRLRINDADQRIFAAWHAILRENERFLERLSTCKIDIETWRQQAELVKNPQNAMSNFDIGFATFFLNRTNRSGIIVGAGPIGGYEQRGDWTLDARFYRKTLLERIEWLGKKQKNIFLTNLDGLAFLKRAARSQYSNRTMFFVDPPYVGAGDRLYMNGMNEGKHRSLAAFLKKGAIENWIVTYDYCPLIVESYDGTKQSDLDVVYSLQKKRTQKELLITPR